MKIKKIALFLAAIGLCAGTVSAQAAAASGSSGEKLGLKITTELDFGDVLDRNWTLTDDKEKGPGNLGLTLPKLEFSRTAGKWTFDGLIKTRISAYGRRWVEELDGDAQVKGAAWRLWDANGKLTYAASDKVNVFAQTGWGWYRYEFDNGFRFVLGGSYQVADTFNLALAFPIAGADRWDHEGVFAVPLIDTIITGTFASGPVNAAAALTLNLTGGAGRKYDKTEDGFVFFKAKGNKNYFLTNLQLNGGYSMDKLSVSVEVNVPLFKDGIKMFGLFIEPNVEFAISSSLSVYARAEFAGLGADKDKTLFRDKDGKERIGVTPAIGLTLSL